MGTRSEQRRSTVPVIDVILLLIIVFLFAVIGGLWMRNVGPRENRIVLVATSTATVRHVPTSTFTPSPTATPTWTPSPRPTKTPTRTPTSTPTRTAAPPSLVNLALTV